MFCTKCGNQINEGIKFCTKCGTPVEGEKAPKSEAVVDNAKPKKKHVGLIVFLIIIIVLALGAGAYAACVYTGIVEHPFWESVEDEDESEDEDDDQIFEGKKGEDEEDEEDEESEEPEEITVEAWCGGYAEHLGRLADKEIYKYAFIDVNGDDIYELVAQGDCEATGNILFTLGSAGVNELQTDRLYFNYIEGGNLICNSDGNMGYYYDIVYTIKDGNWETVSVGTYSEDISQEEPSFEYKWDDVSVNEAAYHNSFAAVYDDEKAVVINDSSFVSYSEIKKILEDAKPTLAATHSVYYKENDDIHDYEIIVADVSWWEASSDCNDRGGYLVHINSDEEYQYILSMIESEGKKDCVFWLGAEKDYITNKYHWSAPYDENEGIYYKPDKLSLEDNKIYDSYWLPGEPSYKDTSVDPPVEEEYLDMFYSKKEGRFVWNDVPYDLVSIVPAYSGKVAYICEYEK